MAKISTDGVQAIEDLSSQAEVDRPDEGVGRQEPVENGLVADQSIVEVSAEQPLVVRETRRLYRLTSSRLTAVVAADTEQEARWLAATHDALRGDWGSPQFASAEFVDTGEVHVFGDVVFSALAGPPLRWSRN